MGEELKWGLECGQDVNKAASRNNWIMYTANISRGICDIYYQNTATRYTDSLAY